MKKMTPMQKLKPELSLLKSLDCFKHFFLNKKRGYTFSNCYIEIDVKAVFFDHILILGTGDTYRDDKNNLRYIKSISLAFNIDKEIVRAGYSYMGGVDYSQDYTVNEARLLIKEFLKDPNIEHFIQIFNINLSRDITKQDLKETVNKLLDKVSSLKEERRNIKQLISNMNVSIKNGSMILTDTVRQEFTVKKSRVTAIDNELNNIYSVDIMYMPYIVRDLFCKSNI